MGVDTGRRVGPFVLGELLGHGGSGSVYMATDARTDRAVTVKLVQAPDAASRARAAREAQVVASVDSPHVLGLLDVVHDGDDLALVRRFVAGETVEQLLLAGPLAIEQALAIACAVARGLAAAHRRGVVHRDVKPSNIIVPRRGGRLAFDQAIVMDFGVLGLVDSSTRLTRTGSVFGTPAYMSPEQLSGSPHGPETDVYGLAAVLYEMVLGRRLHDASSLGELAALIMRGKVEFPAEPRLPDQLRELLSRALSKAMADRPRDASAFLAELEGLTHLLPRELDRPIPGTYFLENGLPQGSQVPVPQGPQRAPPPGSFRPGHADWAGPVAHAAVAAAALAAGALGFLLLGSPWSWLALGVCLAAAGVSAALAAHGYLSDQESEVAKRATDLLIGAGSRDALTQSLAIRLDQLWERCRTSEQEIVWHTVAMMVREYKDACESGDRQSALMNLISLVGELQRRLSPWSVRNEKVVSLGVGVVGIASGAASTVIAIAKALG